MKREKLEQLAHTIAGGLVLIYGFQSFESGNFMDAACCFLLAIIFTLVAGAHTWLIQKFSHADVLFFFIEAGIITYTAWLYKAKGHWVISYLMAAAGILYIVFAISSWFSNYKPSRKRSAKHKRHSAPLKKKPISEVD